MSITTKLENPHIDAIAPTDLYVGRTWIEPTASGGETWIWNGTYWLSSQVYKESINTTSGNTTYSMVFDLDPAYNIFFLNAIATINCTVAATATINWSWNIARINSTGAASTLVSGNNIGQAATTWQTFKNTANVHVNLAATGAVGLRYLDTRTGNISKAGTISFCYRKARILS
jgi:hypothetical protein